MFFREGLKEIVGLKRRRIERAVPGEAKLFKLQWAAEALGNVQMPIVGRDAAFLPIVPARVFFDGGPEFGGRKRDALGKTLDGARHVNFYQNPTDIENHGAKRSTGHGQSLAEPAEAWAVLRLLRRPMIAGRTERITTTPIT